jgi:hypothetical protein
MKNSNLRYLVFYHSPNMGEKWFSDYSLACQFADEKQSAVYDSVTLQTTYAHESCKHLIDTK